MVIIVGSTKLGCSQTKTNSPEQGCCSGVMNRLRPTTNASSRPSDSYSGRKKVTLAPGHSLMDWIRLGRAHGDLSGVGPNKAQVTLTQLSQHNTQKDMWMAVRGKVYNLTPYLDYHPGGVDELMRAAGKDGTDLFDEIHNWVNVESMLEKCLVGQLISDGSSKTAVVSTKSPNEISASESNNTQAPNNQQIASHRSFIPSVFASPVVGIQGGVTHDWYQSGQELVVVVYTKWEDMRHDLVIVDNNKDELLIEVLIRDHTYFLHYKPAYRLLFECRVKVFGGGKVEIKLTKEDSHISWTSLGTPQKMHELFLRTKNIECKYRFWTLMSIALVTHDTRLLRLRAPPECRMVVPVGYHVHIRKDISGMEIARSYTAVVPSLTKPFTDNTVLTGKSMYLMVKCYKGGAISPWLTSLCPGEKVKISNFDGNFDIKRLNRTKHLVMFAAGTGFTSMINLITYSLNNLKHESFPVKLVFFNKTLKDILWHDDLEELVKTHSRFSVTHVLSRESEANWKGLKGRVNQDHIKQFVPSPNKIPDVLLCICGQWIFNDTVESLARDVGLEDKHIHIFTQKS